jgi:hypothetical protein
MVTFRQPQETAVLTKTSVLAITLGLTAIATATIPAAAKPSQHLTSANLHLPSATTTTATAAGSHPGPLKVMIPTAPGFPQKEPTNSTAGVAGKTPGPLKAPMPSAAIASTFPGTLKVPAPSVKGGIDNICPFNPSKCGPQPSGGSSQTQPSGGSNQTQPSGGGIVVVTPGMPVQYPVAVPVPVTTVAPIATVATGAIATATTAGAAYAQAKPGAQGCGQNIPPLAATIDAVLPTAQLPAVDMTRVAVMRDLIQQLASSGKEASARDVEEVAMNILGYNKEWLRCGYGSFTWINVGGNTATNQAR